MITMQTATKMAARRIMVVRVIRLLPPDLHDMTPNAHASDLARVGGHRCTGGYRFPGAITRSVPFDLNPSNVGPLPHSMSGLFATIERRPQAAFTAFLGLHLVVWTALPALL